MGTGESRHSQGEFERLQVDFEEIVEAEQTSQSRSGTETVSQDSEHNWYCIKAGSGAFPPKHTAANWHTQNINSVDFEAKRGLLVTAGQDGCVKLWSIGSKFKNGKDFKKIVPMAKSTQYIYGSEVCCVRFSRRGTKLAIGGADGKLMLLAIISTGQSQSSQCNDVCQSNGDSKSEYAVTPDSKYSLVLDRVLTIKGVVPSRVCSLTWTNTHVVVGCADCTIRCIDCVGKQHALLSGHTGPVTGLTCSPCGNYLASSSSDKNMFIWEASQRSSSRSEPSSVYEWRLGLPSEGPVTAVHWSADGRFLVSCCGKTAHVWRFVSITSVRCLMTLDGHTSEITELSWSADCSSVAVATQDKVHIWGFQKKSDHKGNIRPTGTCGITVELPARTTGVTWLRPPACAPSLCVLAVIVGSDLAMINLPYAADNRSQVSLYEAPMPVANEQGKNENLA